MSDTRIRRVEIQKDGQALIVTREANGRYADKVSVDKLFPSVPASVKRRYLYR